MGFTRSNADLKIIQKLSDYPNMEDGLSSEELKKKFDEGAEILQEDLNKLMVEMEDLYGASKIGVKQLSDGDTSDNNVQGKLLYLLEQIQNTNLGQIADGSITKEKMNIDYANSLAEKNGEMQTNLNAEMVGGKKEEEIGSYTITDSISVSGIHPKETYSWNTMVKGEAKTIKIPNKRFLMVIVKTNMNSSTTDSVDYMFLIDVKGKKVCMLNNSRDLYDMERLTVTNGKDFDLTYPKVYTVYDTSRNIAGTSSISYGAGLAFLSIENGELTIQPCMYNDDNYPYNTERTYTTEIEIATLMANI